MAGPPPARCCQAHWARAGAQPTPRLSVTVSREASSRGPGKGRKSPLEGCGPWPHSSWTRLTPWQNATCTNTDAACLDSCLADSRRQDRWQMTSLKDEQEWERQALEMSAGNFCSKVAPPDLDFGRH
ncbi:uncharacterized protein LOC108588159 [Callithrix jacchus]